MHPRTVSAHSSPCNPFFHAKKRTSVEVLPCFPRNYCGGGGGGGPSPPPPCCLRSRILASIASYFTFWSFVSTASIFVFSASCIPVILERRSSRDVVVSDRNASIFACSSSRMALTAVDCSGDRFNCFCIISRRRAGFMPPRPPPPGGGPCASPCAGGGGGVSCAIAGTIASIALHNRRPATRILFTSFSFGITRYPLSSSPSKAVFRSYAHS